ncbi:MAG: DUF393 domain-containing protein, partial [Planctomycetaceae bacterium]|nr:DUF393 domain-containing protein [Planctomycetaceae bacterium]
MPSTTPAADCPAPLPSRECKEDRAYSIEVFYDGDCPLCLREIQLLRKLDLRGKIRFSNIAASDFELPPGRTWDELMAEIHGRLPDGDWLTGVEVFRRLYGAVTCDCLMAPTRLPGISHLLDWGYRLFARNRLRLTGRCTSDCRLPTS